MPHHVIPILNRPLHLLLSRFHKVKLHYHVVLELGLTDKVQPPLSLRKYSETGHVAICCSQLLQVLNNKLRVFSKLNEEILVCLDALELPFVTLENEVEVNLSIASQFHLNGLRKFMVILDHQFDAQLFGFFERLHGLRFLLDTDEEVLLAAVDHLKSITHCGICNTSGRLNGHHL